MQCKLLLWYFEMWLPSKVRQVLLLAKRFQSREDSVLDVSRPTSHIPLVNIWTKPSCMQCQVILYADSARLKYMSGVDRKS